MIFHYQQHTEQLDWQLLKHSVSSSNQQRLEYIAKNVYAARYQEQLMYINVHDRDPTVQTPVYLLNKLCAEAFVYDQNPCFVAWIHWYYLRITEQLIAEITDPDQYWFLPRDLARQPAPAIANSAMHFALYADNACTRAQILLSYADELVAYTVG